MQLGTEVRFAGHIINGQGSKPDPDKVKAIQDFPVPETESWDSTFHAGEVYTYQTIIVEPRSVSVRISFIQINLHQR